MFLAFCNSGSKSLTILIKHYHTNFLPMTHLTAKMVSQFPGIRLCFVRESKADQFTRSFLVIGNSKRALAAQPPGIDVLRLLHAACCQEQGRRIRLLNGLLLRAPYCRAKPAERQRLFGFPDVGYSHHWYLPSAR